MSQNISDSATWEALPTLTANDEQARRICSLAVGFSCTTHPLSSAEVHALYYPGASDVAFSRAFRRDRMRLAACGITVQDVGAAQEGLWAADASSFAEGGALSASDALLLCALCQQLVDDTEFPHRLELRHALAKLASSYQGVGAVRLPVAKRTANQPVACLLRCLTNHRMAHIVYTDAEGHTSSRTVAPYGSFGLNDALYLVCASFENGSEASLRTFRADRISSAEELTQGFVVPQDFSVGDHILLPFQIGPTIGEARLLVPADAEAAVLAQAKGRGIPEGAHHGDGARPAPAVWSVPLSNLDATASWAVTAGVAPIQPRELVQAWRSTLSSAMRTKQASTREVSDLLSAAGSSRRHGIDDAAQGTHAHVDHHHNQRGRQNALDEARELVALASSLGTEGDTISEEAVMGRLGITQERARVLLDLLLMVGEGDSYLPLGISDDEASLTLVYGNGLHGRPVRLTQSETYALIAALDTAGVPIDDPLRDNVMTAFSSPSVSEQDVRQSLSASVSISVAVALITCAHALADDTPLTFSYQGTNDTVPWTRHAAPNRLTHHDGEWYLEARDLDRDAERSFRLDRMTDVFVQPADVDEQLPSTAPEHLDLPQGRPAARIVQLVFSNDRYLSLLDWPGIRIVARDAVNEVTVAELPWYGTSWLPRHLAACGGSATSTDADLVEALHACSRAALAHVETVPWEGGAHAAT